MLLSLAHTASNVSVHVMLHSAEGQLDAVLGQEGPATSAPGSQLRASLGHTVPWLRRWGLPFSVDGRGHLQVSEGAGPGPVGAGDVRDPHSFAFAQTMGPSLVAGLMVSMDGEEELPVALERRGAHNPRRLVLGRQHDLSWFQVSDSGSPGEEGPNRAARKAQCCLCSFSSPLRTRLPPACAFSQDVSPTHCPFTAVAPPAT